MIQKDEESNPHFSTSTAIFNHFVILGNGNDGDLTPGDEIPSALNNNQDADNISSPQSGAPLMFFNPSQFSNQAISTPNM